MTDRSAIIALPHANLRTRSKRIGVISDNIKQILLDMETATLDWEDHRDHEVGVALAAIQIDQPYRLVVIRNNFDKKEDRTFMALINPEIIKYEGEIQEDYEGCLSVIDIYGKVPRYQKVRVRAKNLKGQEIRLTAEGFLARVLQHEIDHTNGILFVDHIKDNHSAFYRLGEDGKLTPVDYDHEVKDSHVLFA